MANRFHDIDGLQIERWALAGDTIPPLNLGPAGSISPGALQALLVGVGARSVQLAGSEATGQPLLTNGRIGVDVIRIPAGKGFGPRALSSDRVLIVAGGMGTIALGGKVYPTQAGEVFVIDADVPHAITARSDHVLLTVGAPHEPVGSGGPDPVEYRRLLSGDGGSLRCLVCEGEPLAEFPELLHDAAFGCPHCPCVDCVS